MQCRAEQSQNSDNDFRLSQIKNKLKEYQSLPRYTEHQKVVHQQRALNKEVINTKKSHFISENKENQEDTVVTKKTIINDTVPEVIPEESS